jgi:predicted glycosyltransferase
MFVASNGVGIGHVSRLLAIARRFDKQKPIVFVTSAQAVGAIERLGYRAEYLPSAGYVGGDFEQWDRWFRYELETLIESYDPDLVVYDGNNPSHGLVRAVTSRRDCRLAWVRRGLWGTLSSPFIDNAAWFDLIVEPGEIDGQPDNGVTAKRRGEATQVPPARLLDEAELLSRGDAAKLLGLDPSRPAVLIQLGAGFNRDVVTLIDRLVAALRQAPQLQICVADWINGLQSISYWPDVTYVRGYPLSQYFRAFDFSIAAAGYNTFHEIMAFGLPTIFIPNRHPTMDDQAGRAEHAQSLQAAFELHESDLEDLPDLIALLMDGKARDFLVVNGAKLKQENGAALAASLLARTVEARA